MRKSLPVPSLAHLKEGTERCFYCYRLRMEEAYDYAERNGFDVLHHGYDDFKSKEFIKIK